MFYKLRVTDILNIITYYIKFNFEKINKKYKKKFSKFLTFLE